MSAVKRAATRTDRILVAVTVLTLLVAGVAFAYWRPAGSGSATASTRHHHACHAEPGHADGPALPRRPGLRGPDRHQPQRGHRPGRLARARHRARAPAASPSTAAHSGCVLATLSFTTQTNGGAGWTVAGGQALAVTLANALSMTTCAANACQGATFTVYLEAAHGGREGHATAREADHATRMSRRRDARRRGRPDPRGRHRVGLLDRRLDARGQRRRGRDQRQPGRDPDRERGRADGHGRAGPPPPWPTASR